MLLDNIKNIYINNNEASELLLNRNIIWTKQAQVDNPFNIYTWEQIKHMVVDGTVSSVIPLGTETKIKSTDYGYITFKVVDYVYAGTPTLVLLSMDCICTNKWTTSTGFTNYPSSEVANSVYSITNSLSSSLTNVLCYRDCKYQSSTSNVSTTSYRSVIPSLNELNGESGYVALGTKLEYFKTHGSEWHFNGDTWTRSRDYSYTAKNIIIYDATSYVSTMYSSECNINFLIFVGQ